MLVDEEDELGVVVDGLGSGEVVGLALVVGDAEEVGLALVVGDGDGERVGVEARVGAGPAEVRVAAGVGVAAGPA